jgi:hypothetical protein
VESGKAKKPSKKKKKKDKKSKDEESGRDKSKTEFFAENNNNDPSSSSSSPNKKAERKSSWWSPNRGKKSNANPDPSSSSSAAPPQSPPKSPPKKTGLLKGLFSRRASGKTPQVESPEVIFLNSDKKNKPNQASVDLESNSDSKSSHSSHSDSKSENENSANVPSIGKAPSLAESLSKESVHGRECPLCMSEFEAGEIIVSMPCLHSFHEECVKDWFFKSAECPVCEINVCEAAGQLFE